MSRKTTFTAEDASRCKISLAQCQLLSPEWPRLESSSLLPEE